MLLQTFSSFVIQADYFINKDYIAKVLCINRDKPIMHCNGKCYLAKKLKEHEKKDQQAPNTQKEKLDVQSFFIPQVVNLSITLVITKTEYFDMEDNLISSYTHSIFHPPSV